jgi:hypothetical protein
MLTPPSPQFPRIPRTDDPPGNDPAREPRREPEPDVGEPQRSLLPPRHFLAPLAGLTGSRSVTITRHARA